MKPGSSKKRLTFFLVGLIVLAGPLWFFNNLFTSAIERARESAYGLLREEILQAAEDVRNRMRPVNYVADIIKEIHREILPEITPDIIKMLPDADFGKEQFSRELPARFLTAMRQRGLDAIQIIVNPPAFSGVYYWNCDELKRQCAGDEDALAQTLTVNHCYHAAELYRQQYQKIWKTPEINPGFLLWAGSGSRYDNAYTYLSRFSQIIPEHDRGKEYFTDYFGQQSIYLYSYYCISKVNIHGAYSVFVPQSGVSPGQIVKRALRQKPENIDIELVEASERQEGFAETSDGLSYMTLPPSEYWSQLFFWKTAGNTTEENSQKRYLKLSGKLPEHIVRLRKYYRLFAPLAILSMFFYAALAFRFSYKGFDLKMSLKLKLAGILGLIICLPVIGSGILIFLALSGSNRVLENHLLEKAVNEVNKMAIINQENLLGQMLAVLEAKRRLEAADKNGHNLKSLFSDQKDGFQWYKSHSSSINICYDRGENLQYDTSLDIVNPNRLIQSLLSKYIESLGLTKVKLNQPGGHLARTMTLGIMENYITPKMEEAWMIHESTIQREISHSSDTSRAAIFIVRNSNNDYQIVYHRVSNSHERGYNYLSWFNENQPSWFRKPGKYGDVLLGINLRRYDNLFMFAWPTDALLSEEMRKLFEKATSAKNMGHQIDREAGSVTARVWRWKEGEAAIIAALCHSRGSGIAGFVLSMLLPMLTGYAILLLFFITSIISEFISQPVKIIKSGVDCLKNERYGTLIAAFSDDEFKHMTNAFNEMSNALKQREMIKRYVSGRLVEEVQTSTNKQNTDSERLEKVSVLASDIRNFTSTSEKYSPAEIVEMLNSYFTLMEEAVRENGGIIDKYIGDAIQAVFYNDNHQECSAVRACRAAVTMRHYLNTFNQNRRQAGLFTIENGIGIDTGMVISCSIGSEDGRKDFTVIGKTIEFAAQLESLTVGCQSKILISTATLQDLQQSYKTQNFDENAVELLYE